jgi:3-hydroxybutyryl-CoA dehydratase
MTAPAPGAAPFATPGESFAQRVTFDAASIREFAARTGDFNPLHHDDAIAKRSPFGGLIVSGPHVSALLMGLTATHFSKRCSPLGLEFTIRFVRAIPAGTTVELRWTLASLAPKASLGGQLATLDGVAADAGGVVYVRGTGLLLLRPLATPD